jgi:hypothetical protein
MSNSNNQNNINSISCVEERNNIQDEPLFTELSSEAAATIEGGASFLFETTAKDWLNIRERPSATSPIIGKWFPNQKRRMRTPPIVTSSGFRAFGLPNVQGWVSKQFIKLIPGTYRR